MTQASDDFDSLFAAEYASVLRTVTLICHDRNQAQDITQDAFAPSRRQFTRDKRRVGASLRTLAPTRRSR